MNYIYDILYGKIPYSDEDLRLFQTPELSRLRKISVSTIPHWCVPTGICCSRFEHSIGVWHLAKIVGRKPEFREIAKDLAFAALLHDVAVPPFSHGADKLQEKMLGKDHEHLVGDIIINSEIGREIERQGGKMDVILSLINGEGKFGKLINGEIDLDNLDNTLRFGLTMGIFKKKYYSPEKIADSFSCDGEKLFLKSDHGIAGWERCRQVTYRYVYTSYPENMIFRALDLAYKNDDLNKSFFRLDDYEAINYLKAHANNSTKRLIERTEAWQFYLLSFFQIIENATPSYIRRAKSIETRLKLAKMLTKELDLEPEDICVSISRDKGYKKINIPILNKNNEETSHQPKMKERWIIRVYTYKKIDRTLIAKAVSKYFKGII